MKIETVSRGDKIAHILLTDVDLTAAQAFLIDNPFTRRSILSRAFAVTTSIAALVNGAGLTLKEVNPNGTVTASFSTNLTGNNNDLVFTSRTGGPAGNGITVAYVSQGITPSAALSVVTDLIARTITVMLANGAGTKSSLSTALAGSNNDLDFTAKLAGVAGDDISVEYLNPGTPSAALGVVLTTKKITVNLATGPGTPQVETATAAGTITGDGDAAVVVTGAGITGSPVTVNVPVLNGDTAAVWAGKVRTALAANAAITALYTVGGSTTAISLTKIVAAANDATLNISLDNGTCTGITTAATSANTTPGVAPAITSTAAQVRTAVLALAGAAALVDVANTSGNDGSGVVTALAETHLASGVDPVISSTGALVKAALEADADAMRLISVAHKAANDGTGLVTAMAASPLAGGLASQTVDVQTLADVDLADDSVAKTVESVTISGTKIVSPDSKLQLTVDPGTATTDKKDILLELIEL